MIHALPGMGADHRMFLNPWNNLPNFVAHDWPRYTGEQTLRDVACTICREFTIRDGDILVGASIGGMVACEVAKICRIDSLFLVGSATSKQEISRLLTVLHPLADVAPIEWLRFSADKVPVELAQMFATVDSSFVRAMCNAIFQWDGLGSTPVRCFRIHGRRDFVIPPPLRADLLLDGGHLIAMTHAKQCVEFIGAHNRLQRTAK
jgi:pimeloyl-ACP methyl ester carboxylesterase